MTRRQYEPEELYPYEDPRWVFAIGYIVILLAVFWMNVDISIKIGLLENKYDALVLKARAMGYAV